MSYTLIQKCYYLLQCGLRLHNMTCIMYGNDIYTGIIHPVDCIKLVSDISIIMLPFRYL